MHTVQINTTVTMRLPRTAWLIDGQDLFEKGKYIPTLPLLSQAHSHRACMHAWDKTSFIAPCPRTNVTTQNNNRCQGNTTNMNRLHFPDRQLMHSTIRVTGHLVFCETSLTMKINYNYNYLFLCILIKNPDWSISWKTVFSSKKTNKACPFLRVFQPQCIPTSWMTQF